MNKPKPPNLVTVVIITTITVVFWVFFTVYRVLVSEPDTVIPASLMQPVNPTLDIETLSSIRNKKYFTETDDLNPIFSESTSIVDETTDTAPEEVVEDESSEETILVPELEEEPTSTDEANLPVPLGF